MVKQKPYWIVMPIFLYSTPGAHIDIALSKHSLVTYHDEAKLLSVCCIKMEIM